MMQILGKTSSQCQVSVITVIEAVAESIRIAQYRKNSQGKLLDVMLGTVAVPKVIMIRPDDENMTLRRQDVA